MNRLITMLVMGTMACASIANAIDFEYNTWVRDRYKVHGSPVQVPEDDYEHYGEAHEFSDGTEERKISSADVHEVEKANEVRESVTWHQNSDTYSIAPSVRYDNSTVGSSVTR